MKRILTAATAGFLLLGAACGGSSTPTAAEDEAAARRMVLTAADLPGFVEEPQSDEAEGDGPIDRCVNGNPLLVGDNPRGVDGADLSKDDGDLRVQSGALLAVKEAEAVKAFADLKGALASQCLKDAMRETFREGAGPGIVVRDVSAASLAPPPGAEESAASRLTVALERGRERASVYVDLTVLRRDRAVAGVFTFAMGEPFADGERTRLTKIVADRMGAEG